MKTIDLPLAGLSVLVIEDEYILADDARRVLLRAGAEVLGPFGAADEALATARWTRPDCALLDVDLGGGPDFELARALRGRGVPLVFFTGYDMSVVPADLRMERFVEKPVCMAAIVDVVASVCGRSPGDPKAATAGQPWRMQGHAGF